MQHNFLNGSRWIAALGLALCLSSHAGEAPIAVKLKPGDRIVFLGDSATGQHGYTTFVADYFALCHPELHLSFRTSSSNAIWRVADGTVNALPNVQADAIDVHPAIVFVSFGADDGGQAGFSARQFSYFSERLARIVREVKEQKIAVVLVTPADFSADGIAPPGEWYGRVINEVRVVAAKEQIPLLDLNGAMREVRQRMKESKQPAVALTADTSLAPAGHALATLLILGSLGVDAGPASVEIDVSLAKSDCRRCNIEKLSITPDRISFSRTDEALPAILPPAANELASLFPGHALNRYGFKVTALKPGTWKLCVQDMDIGSFTSSELAAGVDLAAAPGPWRALADGVHQKSIAIEDAFFVRCHYGSEPKIPAGAEPQRLALVAKLDAGIEKLVAEQAEITHAARTWNWSLSLEKP